MTSAGIRVGTAGWSYPDWQGIVYPRRKPRGFHPLRYLARYLGCMEINSSFYAQPTADNARRWAHLLEESPDFRVVFKLFRRFTHGPLTARDRDLEGQARVFLEGIEPLREAGLFGGLLVQFPAPFRRNPRSRERLGILRELFGHLGAVLELRHRSWFARDSLADLTLEGWSVALIDLPPADSHPPLTLESRDPLAQLGRTGYLRLHGRNSQAWFDPRAHRDQKYDYLYGPEEVRSAVGAARHLASARGDTYVITNNHYAGKAVANALEILAGLRNGPTLAPPELVECYRRLREVTQTDGQQSLF